MGTPTLAPDPNDLKHFMVSGSAGDFVFHEGDTSLECFVIRDGRVEILKTHHGQPRRLTLLGMGDLFGEGALFDEQSRDVSARAVTEFQLLRIDRATFQRIVQEDPALRCRWRGGSRDTCGCSAASRRRPDRRSWPS